MGINIWTGGGAFSGECCRRSSVSDGSYCREYEDLGANRTGDDGVSDGTSSRLERIQKWCEEGVEL